MEFVTPIIAILALGLGIVNYFHTRKSDKRSAESFEQQTRLSFEQRKQEILVSLNRSEMAIGFCETHLDFITSREAPQYPGLPARKEELRENTVRLRKVLDELRRELKPEMTLIQLEDHYGRSVGLKDTAESVEAMHREVYEAVRDVPVGPKH